MSWYDIAVVADSNSENGHCIQNYKNNKQQLNNTSQHQYFLILTAVPLAQWQKHLHTRAQTHMYHSSGYFPGKPGSVRFSTFDFFPSFLDPIGIGQYALTQSHQVFLCNILLYSWQWCYSFNGHFFMTNLISWYHNVSILDNIWAKDDAGGGDY